ncbi:MAG: hypothetical protein ABEJ06_03040 [Haloarculaceae archaeon]
MSTTIAERTREAVRREPFLLAALRAGVLNYTAAARYLDVDAGEEAVAAALRRYAEELSAPASPSADARVTMQSRLGPADPADALLAVGDAALAPDEGSLTGILAGGTDEAAPGPRELGAVLARLDAEGVAVEAAGAAGGSLVVVVGRRDGPDAVRFVEDVLD